MKKLNLSRWLLTALAAMTVFSAPAVKKTFTAASLNVDGLPPTVKVGGVYTAKLNPDGGAGVDGSKQISKLVSQKGWDFFSVSEAFNYNDELMTSLKGVYNAGTFRSKITDVGLLDVGGFLNGSKHFDTDGLNLLWSNASGMSVSGESWTMWGKRNGTTSNGSDELIAKGFRYYCVTVANGMEVDVYIHHMDAETDAADNAARVEQMNQLADVILASDNKRPILIMGDTNCRYTRDPIKSLFFARINGDDRFEIHDPWIDFTQAGVYPPENSGSIMVPNSFDGTDECFQKYQTGEVVDKIWWIQNSDSQCKLTALNYLHDLDFTWPDGTPISDHYPIVIDFEIEKLADGISDGEYYIRNHQPGKDDMLRYVAIGHDYGTRGIVSRSGNRFTLEPAGENKFKIRNTLNKTTNYMGTGDDGGVWMDWDDSYIYDFIRDANTGLYTIKRNGKVLSIDENDNLVMLEPDASNQTQVWEVFDKQGLLDDLKTNASETNPMDATFMLKGANFSAYDTDNDAWTKWRESENVSSYGNIGGKVENQNIEFYNAKYSRNGKSTWYIEQNLGGMPIGKYKVTFQAFYRDGDQNGTTNHAAATIGGVRQDLYLINNASQASNVALYTPGSWEDDQKTNSNLYVPNSQSGVSEYFNKGKYTLEFDVNVTDGSLPIKVAKESTTNASSWTVIDNFQITYLGPTGETLEAIDRVKRAIDDAQAKADAEGYGSNYNNKAVVNAWESRLIKGNGDTEVHNTYIALAKATTKQRDIPATMTYAILNNSFEMGSMVEWTNNATNAQVVKGSVPGSEGDYYLKADKGSITYAFEVTMPNGLYEAKAMVSPGTVLEAGGLKSTAATGNAGELSEAVVRFMIKDGAATITATNSGQLLADNFTLRRVGGYDSAKGFEMISLAIKDATERVNKMGAPYNDGWAAKMQPYQAKVDNLDIDGNGLAEFNEIYGLLRAQVYQRVKDKKSGDCTNAIINNSFEFGDIYGWDLMSTAGDTGVKPNSDGTYTISPVDGSYVFNTWNEGRGTILSQTINNLPAGHYQLSAYFASDAGDQTPYVYLEVKGQEGVASQKKMFPITNDKTKSQTCTLEFEVAANTPSITICAGAGNNDGTWDDFGGNWYKVDNFQLIRTGDEDRCFFYKRLRDAIDEANSEAANLPARYSSQWPEKANKYEQIIATHLDDGHDPDDEKKPDADENTKDPMTGSGIKEINALFADLRELIFSQTESGANMSGAIINNSFELGDMTGWSCTADPEYDAKVVIGNEGGTYGSTPIDGKYLFNCWKGGNVGRPIYQVIPNVPSGKYTLTLKIASDAGNQFIIGANKKFSEIYTIPARENENDPEEKTVFHDISFTFEVPVEAESKDVRIGVFPTINDKSYDDIYTDDADGNPQTSYAVAWYKVDDFRLTLDSRYLEIPWEMETDTHGTIILPYDVEADVLDEKSLEVYLVTESTDTETPLDDDINTYRLLKFEKAPYLKANTPYVVKNTRIAYTPAPETEAEPVAQKRVKIKAEGDEILTGDGSDPERPRVYTFSGYTKLKDYVVAPENPEEEGKNMLTGILEEREAEVGEHHFQMEGENVAFVLHGDDNVGVDHEMLQPYHAYIDHNIDQYREFVTGFYFYEPIMNLPWEMEHADFGTLILPFDHELPAELKAYRLKDVSEKRNNAIGTDAEGTYQVLEMEEVSEITANIPYFITLNDTKAAKRAKRAALRSEESGNYSYVFTGQPQNTEETYKHDGVLRGTILTDNGVKKADDSKGVHILTADGTFEPLADDATTTIGAYHAYVNSDRADNKSTLLLEEPIYDPEWSMECPEYGTIILPYAKELPEGLEAYPISSIGEQKKMPMGTTDGNRYNNGETYQMITLGDKTTSLEANTPYIVKPVVAEENADVPATLADEAIDLSGYRNHANEKATVTVNGLTGVNNATPVEKGDYITTDNANGFEQNAANSVTINAHHAYLKADAIEADESGNKPTYLLVTAPVADPTVNVEEILTGEEPVDIYTLQGVRVAHDVVAAEGLRSLEPGIYVLRSGDKTVKVIK
ncbi:MAG: hypothetical protein K2K97_04700 [Muribaculaceae bacterium]|nr:hypothetical protein [Muribaculaceae bacterium]